METLGHVLREDAAPVEIDGYLDLLGGRDPTGSRPGQRLMVSRALPQIYEKLWRPVLGRVLIGESTADERRTALELLELGPGDRVLDVGCGPGNFSRAFARVGGRVVGLDASATMLAEAVRAGGGVEYVRGDAADLPFRDASFDAVCCFAALYFIEQPLRAIAEMARVLAPGGRIALLSSVSRGPLPAAVTDRVVRGVSGVRMFGRDELTGALRELGLTDVRGRVAGFAQYAAARRPPAS
jgi:SAM-dependent methyltransferase